jgi:hypothetical protein
VVAGRSSERGTALVFALAALTLIAITIGAVTAEIQSRGAGVVLEERMVRVTALSDAAMAETLAELATTGVTFPGVTERRFEGGTVLSLVRPKGAWEVEVVAVGRRNDWQATVTASVFVKDHVRILWWQRTQGPIAEPVEEP